MGTWLWFIFVRVNIYSASSLIISLPHHTLYMCDLITHKCVFVYIHTFESDINQSSIVEIECVPSDESLTTGFKQVVWYNKFFGEILG